MSGIPSEPDLPVCERADQLRALDGRRVRLIGRYRPVRTPKKMRRPGAPEETVDLGYVVIVLDAGGEDGGAEVSLGSDPRPEDEIAELEGRRVESQGTLLLQPDVQSGAAARMPTPVLRDPTSPRPLDRETERR